MGRVESGELAPLLRQIADREQRGLLSIQGEQDLVSITFERGVIVAADAMNHPAEEMLGEVLANEGWLSPAEFGAALSPHADSGKLASEILAEADVIDGRLLVKAVRLQTYRQVLRVLRWRAGEFDWTADVESPYHAGVEPISVAELLLRASDELGSDGPLTGGIPELDSVFESNPDTKAMVKPLDQLDSSVGPAPSDHDVVWLTKVERRLLEAVDGQQPSSLLMLQSGLDPFQVKYALYYLERSGLIRVRHHSSSSALRSALGANLSGGEMLGGVDGQLNPEFSLRLDEEILGTARPLADIGGEASGEAALEDVDDTGSFLTDPGSGKLEGLLEPEVERTAEAPVRRQPLVDVVGPWLARGLALAFVALLIGTLSLPTERDRLLLPFPWLAEERNALDELQRRVAYDKIDQGIRSYYLLFGRYPEELGLLSDLQLLRSRDLYDPDGHWLAYSVAGDRYRLQPLEGGEPLDSLSLTASIEEDFLLNPRYVDQDSAAEGVRPIVLLD